LFGLPKLVSGCGHFDVWLLPEGVAEDFLKPFTHQRVLFTPDQLLELREQMKEPALAAASGAGCSCAG
tara:strand:- start:125 stop:328 length:204 start_codon:yes stop_codon:yes gene_type:complete